MWWLIPVAVAGICYGKGIDDDWRRRKIEMAILRNNYYELRNILNKHPNLANEEITNWGYSNYDDNKFWGYTRKKMYTPGSKKQPVKPLHMAMRERVTNLAIIELLIEKGADVNACDLEGQTPLYWASSRGNIKKVELLIEKGADVNLCYGKGQAQSEEWYSLNGEKRAPSHTAGWTPLYGAIVAGRTAVAKLLLENGARSSRQEKTGRTPLDEAIKRGQKELVKILLTQPEYNDQQRRDYSDRFDCCRWEETVCDECGVILEEGHTGLCKKCKAAAHEELLAAGVTCDECGMELEGIGPGLCRECMHQREGGQGNIYYQPDFPDS